MKQCIIKRLSIFGFHMNPRIRVDESSFFYSKKVLRCTVWQLLDWHLEGRVSQVRISFDKIGSSPSIEKLWAQLSKWERVVASIAQFNTSD